MGSVLTLPSPTPISSHFGAESNKLTGEDYLYLSHPLIRVLIVVDISLQWSVLVNVWIFA